MQTNVEAGVGPQDTTFNLVERARAGDFDAYRALMRQNNQRLFRIARSILKEDDEASDVVQEAYVKAFCHLDDFNGPRGFRTWLAQITKNEALQRLRKRRRTVLVDDSALEIAMNERGGGPRVRMPDEHMQDAQLRKILEREVDLLPEAFRATFILRGVEEMSVEETSAILGITAATIKTQYHRARKILKERLTAALADEPNLPSDVLSGNEHLAFEFAGRRCDRIVAKVCVRMQEIVDQNKMIKGDEDA